MNPYVKFTKILHSSVGAWVATLGGLLASCLSLCPQMFKLIDSTFQGVTNM